jgi:hypothetical protein
MPRFMYMTRLNKLVLFLLDNKKINKDQLF